MDIDEFVEQSPVVAGFLLPSIPAQTKHPIPIKETETPTMCTIRYLTPRIKHDSTNTTGMATQSSS